MTSLENQNSTVEMWLYPKAVSLRFSSKVLQLEREETPFLPNPLVFEDAFTKSKHHHHLQCKHTPLQVTAFELYKYMYINI